ncbi:MAG: ThuA domain-containing protein [Candidatus Lokiarchaeota archaeon]|nr:ThuA domain-containing protein [Candidatus Lokiarchaeota archaeon]
MAKKALCVYGGWKGHTPKKSMKKMIKILQDEGFEIVKKKTLDAYKDRKLMESLDLVVQCWTGGNLEKDQEDGLSYAVMDGVGLVGWHGGLCDSFRNNVQYQFMTGAQWVSHPGGAKMTYEVNFIPEKKEDPIIKGLNDFKITSEQYYMHVDPAVEVLATTTFHSMQFPWIEGIKMPVVFKKRWGDGKVFYASIGHTYKDFNIPDALEMMRRGMLWASELEELDLSSDQDYLKVSF